MRRQLVTLAVIACSAPASSAYAHHSHPRFYDACRSITIEGRVERVEYQNPHTWIFLRLDDGTVYTVDWAPLTRLTNSGVVGPAREALVVGARVAVAGDRIRPAAQIREHFPDFKSDVNRNTVDPRSIRRVDDSFSWALPPRANPPNCDSPAVGRLAFEAATIKLAAPDAVRNRVMPASPNRLYIPGMTLTWLIYTAYGDGGFNTSMRVTGGPDWVNRTAFAVEGIASAAATPRQLRLMLQSLLEERFALKIRNVTETHDGLTLVPDRSDGTLGPKVRKWDGTCPRVMPALYFQAPRRPLQRVDDKFVVGPASEADDPGVPYCPTGYRAGGITIDGATMFTVAEMLSLPPGRALLGTVTQDRTGLTDRYTMELDYPFPPTGPAAPAAPPEFAGLSLSTAVREQWGLRLVPGKGPLKVVIVESAQLPTGN